MSTPIESKEPVNVSELEEVPKPTIAATSSVTETLGQAAEGLLFPSETDAPITPFFWAHPTSTAPTSKLVADAIHPAQGQPIKSVRLDTFFRPVIQEEEWHNDTATNQTKRPDSPTLNGTHYRVHTNHHRFISSYFLPFAHEGSVDIWFLRTARSNQYARNQADK